MEPTEGGRAVLEEIHEIINRETTAWNTQNADLLLSIFHTDMVWVWPKNADSHNPIDWETPLGKFDFSRWKKSYAGMFSEFVLVHNYRQTIKVVETNEGDGGFAIVDIDTLWKNKTSGKLMLWLGRTCKTYVKTKEGYKMIAQTGVLSYSDFL
jgi:hypothetical protein